MDNLLQRLRRAVARRFFRATDAPRADADHAAAPPDVDHDPAWHVAEVDMDDAAVFGTTDWVLDARDARALLVYGVFDPVEPVLSAVTLIDFGERRSQTIVHARLSPFTQQFSVLATLARTDDDGHRVSRALLRACVHNGDPSWPLVQRAPTFIAEARGLPLDAQRDAYRYLLAHTSDVVAIAAALAEHPNDPWARATTRIQHASERGDDAANDAYIARAMVDRHVRQELDAMPNAWQSAIDYQAELGRTERVERALPWEAVATFLAKLEPIS